MSRNEPANRMEAFAYQFKDDANLLLKLATIGDEKSFNMYLGSMQRMMDAYNNKHLQNSCKKTQRKYAARQKYLRDNGFIK